MARLFDHVRACAEVADLQFLDAATVVSVDNVAMYWNEHMADPQHSFREFPTLALPLDPMWLEYRCGDIYASQGVVSANLPTQWGAILTVLTEESVRRLCDRIPAYANALRVSGGEVKWVVTGLVYGRRAGVVQTMAGVFLPLDANGKIHPESDLMLYTVRENQSELSVRNAGTALQPMLFAISLMHCKNVVRQEASSSDFEVRAWKGRHRQPLCRHYVLDIEPMRKVLKREGGADVVGLKKALHICRGHFATYTDSAPLFGRRTGTFWIPQHLRGDANRGVVKKDYRIKV